MTSPAPAAALADEVARAAVRPGAVRVLLLDVDGTLAPIAPTPEQAAVPAATLRALARLIGQGWTVAPVSGRPADQVRAMIPLEGARAFGSHGLEGSLDGSDEVGASPEARERLRRVAAAAAPLLAQFPGVRLETKPVGLAFHDRQLADESLAPWHARLEAWLAQRDLRGLETLRGKRVVEIRPLGAHKGRVVRIYAEALGLRSPDLSFVAVGDDATDEDMFREIRGLGLGVRVGQSATPTAATRRLDSPAAVEAFLRRLALSGGTGC